MTKQEKREQILQAAEKLFSRRRFHEITTDDIAREAGVGKGTIYRYFQDKDDLFFEAANAGFDELCDLLRRTVPGQAAFGEQLLKACIQISGFFEGRRQMFQMMHTEAGQPAGFSSDLRQRWREKRKKLVEAVAAVLRRGLSEGRLRSDIPPEVMAHFLLSMLRAQARDLRGAPEAMRQHKVVVDMFCYGAVGRAPADGHRPPGKLRPPTNRAAACPTVSDRREL